MKVMQTLGRHANTQEGIFQYRRTGVGVRIDTRIGRAEVGGEFVLTHDEWTAILKAIRSSSTKVFRITRSNSGKPPKQSLYDLISQAVPTPSKGWNWTDSVRACVVAILEHEGSIDLYHGTLGGGHTSLICLKRNY